MPRPLTCLVAASLGLLLGAGVTCVGILIYHAHAGPPVRLSDLKRNVLQLAYANEVADTMYEAYTATRFTSQRLSARRQFYTYCRDELERIQLQGAETWEKLEIYTATHTLSPQESEDIDAIAGELEHQITSAGSHLGRMRRMAEHDLKV